MATKKELEKEVARLNEKYFKNKKNHLRVDSSNNGYAIELTGRLCLRGKKVVNKGMSGGILIGNQYHGSVNETLCGLYKADSYGWIKSTAKYNGNRK